MTQELSVGLLIPSSNTVMERDLHREFDPPHLVHTARMLLDDVTAAAEQRMLDEEAVPAARRVAAVRPDLVVFGCTSASSLHGRGYDDAFRATLAETTGTPVIGVLSSAIAELTGARGIAVFTPYVEELTASIAESLAAAGLPVVAAKGLGIKDNNEIGAIEPDAIVAAVSDMDLGDADVVFCSCTNLRAYETRSALAQATGRRVVTSNQAVAEQVRASLRA